MGKNNRNKAEDLNTVPFKTRVRPYLIVAPSLIITIGIMIPFVMAIWFSLTNYSFKLPNHKFVGLKNWVDVLSSGTFWNALLVSLLYGIISTVVEMAIGMGVAILLSSFNPSPNSSIWGSDLSSMLSCRYLHLSQSAAGRASQWTTIA